MLVNSGINEDHGGEKEYSFLAVAGTVAHEMGHNLGSRS